MLFLGHSFIEGNSLANTPEGFDARYAMIVKNKLKGKAVISEMGRAKTSDLLKRLKMDLNPFEVKCVV